MNIAIWIILGTVLGFFGYLTFRALTKSFDLTPFAPMEYKITDEAGIEHIFLVDMEEAIKNIEDFKRMKNHVRDWSPACRVEVWQGDELIEIATIEDIFS